ncbi:MAG: DUF3504 domain-containing protein [Candidatus Thiodiazotropha sp.]
MWGDIQLGYDTELNLEYLEYNERQTKTRTGVDTRNIRPEKPRMYATGTERCPIQVYKSYDSLRPENFSRPEDPFYLGVNTINKNPNMTETWFLRAPVGKHKLANFMKSMVKSAELPSDGNQKLTNTSVRKALCQKLLEANVPDTQAIHITGHKNASSLNNYRKLNNHQQASLSHLLANFQGSTNSNTSTGMTLSQSTQNRLTKQETKNTAQPVFFPGAVISGGTFKITIKAGSKRKYVLSDSESDSQ